MGSESSWTNDINKTQARRNRRMRISRNFKSEISLR